MNAVQKHESFLLLLWILYGLSHSGGRKCNVTAVTEGVATELKQPGMYPAPSFSPADERLSGFNSIQWFCIVISNNQSLHGNDNTFEFHNDVEGFSWGIPIGIYGVSRDFLCKFFAGDSPSFPQKVYGYP